MITAFYLLTLVGLIGSYDVFYWHWYRLRLFRFPEARMENLTHAIRAYLFAFMMMTVIHVDARGWWWPVYPVVLAFELINTMTDVILEPKSRRNIGGLPPVEYIIHIFLSLITGAALASVIWGTRALVFEPSYLGLRTIDVSLPLRIGAYSSVVAALAIGSFELNQFLRLSAKRPEKTDAVRVATRQQA